MRLDRLWLGFWCLCLAARGATGVPTWSAVTAPQAGGGALADLVVGFEFSTARPILLTHLGQFDWNGDGLLAPGAVVTVWDVATGFVLVAVPLAQPTLEGNVFYSAVRPTRLEPGRYVIAVQMAGGAERFGFDTPVSLGPGLAWGGGRAKAVNSLGLPESVGANAVAYFGPNFKYTLVAGLALSRPTLRAVFQRDGQNRGRIPIEGGYADAASRIEARAVPVGRYLGTDTGWQVVDPAPRSGKFTGYLPAAAGWYRLEVRLIAAGQTVDSWTVEPVGVGDVFVTAGQSNAANYGLLAQKPGDDRVCADGLWLRNGLWRWATDPQPGPDGGWGSPWPILGTLWAVTFGVPAGFISVARGGTSVENWQPEGALYGRLREALVGAGPGGVRAVLWHQGEWDNLEGTSSEAYAQRLTRIIAQTRLDAGWAVPWGVARAAYHPQGTPAAQTEVVAGQQQVILHTPGVFFGPMTDDLVGPKWRYDSVHFNTAGLQLHAQRWLDALTTYVYASPAPTVPLSVFRAGDRLQFSWEARNGARLQKTRDLGNPDWLDLWPTLNTREALEPLTGETWFYRLFRPSP